MITIRTPEQIVDAHNNWLTYRTMRRLLSKRNENGLSCAVMKIGKRVLIDADKFEEWLDSYREV